ncbi:hypothetical protein ACAG96_08560 [Candidatus Izemoplasma sp. B36]|uniref:hypothetical protein n=1 Tax=Candidatus Izemoplasma sp. B36 TaxID=3242468 RepID=UPI003556D27E
MKSINYEQVKEELRRKNLYDIQKELTLQRRTRTAIMSFLVFALVFTFVFGTLEDPFIYTLSNIGNFFTYRMIFIIWSMIAGVAIELAVVSLFKLEGYKNKMGIIAIYLAAFFLIATGIIPALKETYPFWHYLHTFTSGVLAIFLYIAVVPFSLWISKENPRLRISIIIWQVIIWAGSILMVILYWHSALFEIWFFVSTILFLLYLCLVLFEEAIIKKSVKLMMDEENLNIAMEKIFVDLDSASKRQNKKHKSE